MAQENYIRQFKKGSLELILLRLIARKESYGYELLAALNQNGGEGFGHAREGTVYPILYRLEHAGLVRCRLAPSEANGGLKKYYSLTPEGRKSLDEMTAFWREYTAYVNRFLDGAG